MPPAVESDGGAAWPRNDAMASSRRQLFVRSCDYHGIDSGLWDNDKLVEARHYDKLSLETGLWSLEQGCRRFVEEAAITDLERICHYADWKDVTARDIVSFLTHEAVHHLWDIRRFAGIEEAVHV